MWAGYMVERVYALYVRVQSSLNHSKALCVPCKLEIIGGMLVWALYCLFSLYRVCCSRATFPLDTCKCVLTAHSWAIRNPLILELSTHPNVARAEQVTYFGFNCQVYCILLSDICRQQRAYTHKCDYVCVCVYMCVFKYVLFVPQIRSTMSATSSNNYETFIGHFLRRPPGSARLYEQGCHIHIYNHHYRRPQHTPAIIG